MSSLESSNEERNGGDQLGEQRQDHNRRLVACDRVDGGVASDKGDEGIDDANTDKYERNGNAISKL